MAGSYNFVMRFVTHSTMHRKEIRHFLKDIGLKSTSIDFSDHWSVLIEKYYLFLSIRNSSVGKDCMKSRNTRNIFEKFVDKYLDMEKLEIKTTDTKFVNKYWKIKRVRSQLHLIFFKNVNCIEHNMVPVIAEGLD